MLHISEKESEKLLKNCLFLEWGSGIFGFCHPLMKNVPMKGNRPVFLWNLALWTSLYFIPLLGICLLVLCWGVGLHAQQDEVKQERMESIIEAAGKKMGMDDETIAFVADIYISYNKQLANTKKRKFKNVQSQQKAIRTILKAREIELFDILSQDQIKEFGKLLKSEQAGLIPSLEKEKKKALGVEIGSYLNHNVYPVVSRERVELNKQLPKEDTALFKIYHSEMTSLTEQLNQETKACQKLRSSGADRMEVRKCKAKLSEIKAAQKEKTENMQAYMQKRDAILRPYLDRLAKSREQWSTDINQLIASAFETTVEDTLGYFPKAGRYLSMTQPINFLLMKTDGVERWLEGFEQWQSNNTWKLIQNHTSNQLHIFGPQETSNVKIELFDQEGNLVDSFAPDTFNGRLDIASHQYANRIYFLKIKTQGQQIVEKVMIQ